MWRIVAQMALGLVAMVLAVMSAACPAAALARGAGGAAVYTTASPVDDLTHIAEVQARLQALQGLGQTPPALVLYIADSTGRESVWSETGWTKEMGYLTKSALTTPVAHMLASRNQAFAQDAVILEGLPEGLQGIVLIGVGLSRFTASPAATPALPAVELGDSLRLSPWEPHRYSRTKILTAAQKQAAVRRWRTKRYPVFKRNFAANRDRLAALVKACIARGLHPVLVDLPLNLKVVGHALDTPRHRYRDACLKIANDNGIDYLRFVGRVGLVSRDFYDFIHLVEPGRVKWQTRLSSEIVALLESYGLPSSD